MKNLLVIIFSFFLFVPSVWAFSPASEAMVDVNSAPVYSYSPSTGDEMSNAVAKVSREVKSSRKAEAKHHAELKKENGQIRGAVTELAKNQKEAVSVIRKESNMLSEQGARNAWILGGLIVLVGIVVLIRTNIVKGQTTEAIQPVIDNQNKFVKRVDEVADLVGDTKDTVVAKSDELLNEVRMGFAEMRTSFTKLPAEIATAIHTLDASPFEFESAGHQVTYQSPIEGISEGYYLVLHVPKDEQGEPATCNRPHDVNRGVARQNCRRTMKKYFEGAFDAPEYALQKGLIEYLIKTGDISFRKIS